MESAGEVEVEVWVGVEVCVEVEVELEVGSTAPSTWRGLSDYKTIGFTTIK